MSDTYHARSGHPDDVCMNPECSHVGCVFATEIKKFGMHVIRACAHCASVYENGKRVGDLAVWKEPVA